MPKLLKSKSLKKQNIKPEEIDSCCLDMDEEEELALMEWVKRVHSKKKNLD